MEGKLILVVVLSVLATAFAADNVTAVPDLDVGRYLGLWNEIARLPQFFQKNCTADVTATYTANDDGSVGVHNACVDVDGNTITADGIARIADPSEPAKLKVTFSPEWLADLFPFLWAPYWVIALEPEYQWALVGEPERRFLWILSRSTSLDQSIFDSLKATAEGMGYDLTNLIVSGTVN